jgi:hypothetical protein
VAVVHLITLIHADLTALPLTKVIEISERDRDALPGSAVKLVKAARRIMLKRRKS